MPHDEAAWAGWVRAAETRHHALGQPLLDWLEAHGRDHGYVPDRERAEYDRRCDFVRRYARQSRAFQDRVALLLRRELDVVTIPGEDPRSLERAQASWTAMERGAPAIYRPVLRDAETRTYGSPELLVRSDWLARLVPEALDPDEAAVAALELGVGTWHYRVVGVAFTTLHLLADGRLGRSGSAPARQLRLWLLNGILGRLQGWTPPCAFLLGRSWDRRRGSRVERGTGCLERLAQVPARDPKLAAAAAAALGWLRLLRREGAGWQVLPRPSCPQLRPDGGVRRGAPWQGVKRELAHTLGDPTVVWGVGRERRDRVLADGIERWGDPRCTAATLGVVSPARARVIDAILAVNREPAGPAVRPTRVGADGEAWRDPEPLELFVDFEAVSDLGDDLSQLPRRGGQALIALIGCGHYEDGVWQQRTFVVPRLDVAGEGEMLRAWFDHLASLRARFSPSGPPPRLFHWAPTETQTLETAYNAAVHRHPRLTLPELRWYDLLARVIRAEPVVVRGAFEFRLKSIAGALRELGAITARWPEPLLDGLAAMSGLWAADEEARARGCRLEELELVQTIARYNAADCLAVAEILGHLRREH